MDDALAPTSIMKGPDRWLLWPSAALLAAAFFGILFCGLPGTVSFFLIPLVVLGGPIAAVGLLFPAVLLAKRGKTRKAISVALAVMLPILLWKPIFWMADCAHIALTVGLGGGQIGTASTSEADRFAAYDWSVGLAGGPNTFLIYDPTDNIALSPTRPKNLIVEGIGEACAGRVDHLVGHYYKCTF